MAQQCQNARGNSARRLDCEANGNRGDGWCLMEGFGRHIRSSEYEFLKSPARRAYRFRAIGVSCRRGALDWNSATRNGWRGSADPANHQQRLERSGCAAVSPAIAAFQVTGYGAFVPACARSRSWQTAGFRVAVSFIEGCLSLSGFGAAGRQEADLLFQFPRLCRQRPSHVSPLPPNASESALGVAGERYRRGGESPDGAWYFPRWEKDVDSEQAVDKGGHLYDPRTTPFPHARIGPFRLPAEGTDDCKLVARDAA